MNNPFRYAPADSVREEAERLILEIATSPELDSVFSEGKMLGVLEAEKPDGSRCFLRAFSGLAGGRSQVEGFVPPVFDLTVPGGHFKTEEAEISALAAKLVELEESEAYRTAREELDGIRAQASETLSHRRSELNLAKAARKRKREQIEADNLPDKALLLAELDDESRHEKAELHRLALSFRAAEASAEAKRAGYAAGAEALKAEMKSRSDALQRWIFEHYTFHDSRGSLLSLREIFARRGMVPPGGTGDCAAPKLLEYAFRHGLKPLSMGEFWYGRPSGTHVQGRFYPSCQSKCAVLLEYMLDGIELDSEPVSGEWKLIYEDGDLIVVDKPSGMLSVPGRTDAKSLPELLEPSFGRLYPVHRLDMDTSGLIVFARNPEAQSKLMASFESREVVKEYVAVLDPLPATLPTSTVPSSIPPSGTINLPLSQDYENRPCSKVDFVRGAPALTRYELAERFPDGSLKLRFRPLTGRTHQLRLHSAHPSGLGRTISGDRLYGSATPGRLRLHAFRLEFRHPSEERTLSFCISEVF
ncbi:MAG: RNA pseudouridine synthase [Bacteroidales bacterium]|nr:RNA pseudouridine synthase [Bacteroidales bacterium]